MTDDELTDALNYFEAKRARKEALWLLGLVKPSGALVSHNAAEDFEGWKGCIIRDANEGNREFFIEFGKLLEGKRLKPNTWIKLDKDVAFILCFDPKVKSTEAVRLLIDLGHPSMTPWAFKQLKYNWRRAAKKTRKRLEKLGRKYPGNRFLDGDDPDDET
jgi:hypothetical protein